MKSKEFYKTKAWRFLSRFVKLYYANSEGYVQCSTSGIWMPVNDKKTHCGHFIKVFDGTKTNMSVAFEFENLAPQSHQDNVYSGGKPDIMKEWLIREHGQEKIDKLLIKKHNTCKIGAFELEYFGNTHEKLFKKLVEKRGFNPWK